MHFMISTQTILWYGTDSDAKNGFDASVSHEKEMGSKLEEIKQMSYHSQISQSSVILCSETIGDSGKTIPFCTLMVLYNSYVVIYTSYINPPTVTYSDFEHTFKEIDKKMEIIAGRSKN